MENAGTAGSAALRFRAPLPLLRLMPKFFAAALLLLQMTLDASAHASDRGYVLLLPTGHYIIGGAMAVAASFLALVLLPPRSLGGFARVRLRLFRLNERARPLVSFLAFLVLCVLIAAGFLGSRD